MIAVDLRVPKYIGGFGAVLIKKLYFRITLNFSYQHVFLSPRLICMTCWGAHNDWPVKLSTLMVQQLVCPCVFIKLFIKVKLLQGFDTMGLKSGEIIVRMPSIHFWLRRQRFFDIGLRGNQERCRCIGRFSLSRGLRLHQHPWRSISERQRRSSAPLPVWTLPHISCYSCK